MLYLGISVNGNTPAGTVPVKVIDDRYWVPASVLRQAHIPLPEGEALVDVSLIPSVQVEYDRAGQMLRLKVPESWLPEQRIDNTTGQNYRPPLSTPGLLFNYDSYSLASSDGSKTTSTSTETRFSAPRAPFPTSP